MVGLVEAAHRYKPDVGATFATYCTIRVQGAILDQLRRDSWTPRKARDDLRKFGSAMRGIEQALGRRPTPHEIAVLIGQEPSEEPHPVGDEPKDPLALILEHEDRVELNAAINDLPERERRVIEMSLDGMRLSAIGKKLRISESRACQLRQAAIQRLAR